MKANEIIVRVMENTLMQDGRQFNQTRMAEGLSEKTGKVVTPAAVNDRLKNENMKITNFIEMLDLMGYEVVVRPKNDKRESYVVDPGTDRKRVK